jgi:citrate/tricarballylate utilization protein
MLEEVERVMRICNACRYCEGFCAVFPAMELRRVFSPADLQYLANLCHDCRDCYYACQYAPPHEFSLNFPSSLAELRLETYRKFAWPKAVRWLLPYSGLTVFLTALLSVLWVVLGVYLFVDPSVLFSVHVGENAFYRIVPYAFILFPFSAMAVFISTVLLISVHRLWQETGARTVEWLDLRSHIRTLGDVVRLRYLGGGGYGCNYPDDRFSMLRRWFHQMTLFGFLACLVSTAIAAGFEHLLHWHAPYPLMSWPVLTGTLGGLALLVGSGGSLILKLRMDKTPAGSSQGMDLGFIMLLLFTSLTGLLLLALRDTGVMGLLLAVHLGFVLALFITLPYGKFIHSLYRYAALLLNNIERSHCDSQSRADEKGGKEGR